MPSLVDLVAPSEVSSKAQRRAAMTALFAPLPPATDAALDSERGNALAHAVQQMERTSDRASSTAAKIIINQLMATAERSGDAALLASVRSAAAVLAMLSPYSGNASPVVQRWRVPPPAAGSVQARELQAALASVEGCPEVIRAQRWSTSIDPAATAAVRDMSSLRLTALGATPNRPSEWAVATPARSVTSSRDEEAMGVSPGREGDDEASDEYGSGADDDDDLPPSGSLAHRKLKSYWQLTRDKRAALAKSRQLASGGRTEESAEELEMSSRHSAHPDASARDAKAPLALCLDGFTRQAWHPRGLRPIVVAAHRAILGLPDPFGFVVVTEMNTSTGMLERVAVRTDLPPALSSVAPMLAPLALAGNQLTVLSRFVTSCADDSTMRAALGAYGAAQIQVVGEMLDQLRRRVSDSLDSVVAESGKLTFPAVAQNVLRLRSTEVRRIRHLAALFDVVDDGEGWRPNDSLACCGISLLSSVYSQSDAGESFVSPLLLEAALAPLMAHVTRWVTCGTLADPFDEFFIVAAPQDSSSSGFVVDPTGERRPSFISHQTAEALLEAGVAAAVLKQTLGPSVLSAFGAGAIATAMWDSPYCAGMSDLARSGHGAPQHVVDLLEGMARRPAVHRFRAGLDAWLDGLQEHVHDDVYGARITALQRAADVIAANFVPARTALTLGHLHELDRANAAGASDAVVASDQGGATRSASEQVVPAAVPAAAVTALRGRLDQSDAASVISTSTAAEQWRDYMEEAKELARQRIVEEHERRMRVAEQKRLRLDWKARRQALAVKRREALVRQVEDIDATLNALETGDYDPDWEQPSSRPLPADADANVLGSPTTAQLPFAEAAEFDEHDVPRSVRADDPGPAAPPGGGLDDSLAAAQAAGEASPVPLRNDTMDNFDHDDVVPKMLDDDGDSAEHAQRFHDARQELESSHDDRPLSVASDAQIRTDDHAFHEGACGDDIGDGHVDEADDVAAMDDGDMEDADVASVGAGSNSSSYDLEAVSKVYTSYMPEIDDPKVPVDPDAAAAVLAHMEHRHRPDVVHRRRDHFSLDDDSDDEAAAFPHAIVNRNRASQRASAGAHVNSTVGGDLAPSLSEAAESARRQLTSLALRSLLTPFVPLSRQLHPGRLGAVCRGLIDVFLMQNNASAATCAEVWIDANFPAMSSRQGVAVPDFDANVAFLTMTSAWDALWSESSYPLGINTAEARDLYRQNAQDVPIQVTLVTEHVHGGDSGKREAPRNPFDLLGATSFNVGAMRGIPEAWLLPIDFVARYGYVFKTLMLWRYVDHLCKGIWAQKAAVKSSQLWLFLAAARSVTTIISSHVWHSTMSGAREFLANIDVSNASATWHTVERLRAEHDEFLAVCHSGCLLTPGLAKARRTLHGLVRLMAEVHHSCSGHAQPQMLIRFIAKRRQDFEDTTKLLIRQLREADRAGQDVALLVATLEASVQNHRR